MRKGPPPYVGMGPRMVNPALVMSLLQTRACERSVSGENPAPHSSNSLSSVVFLQLTRGHRYVLR